MLSTALAGGYFYSTSGIVAAGRGGAWIAGADTQFAQYYNPAGLIRVQKPTFNIGLSLVQQNITFDRIDDDGLELPTAKNNAPPYSIPQLGFATPLIPGKLHFAIGMVSPFAPSSDYDAAGSQRYSVIKTQIYQFTWGPSIAYRPHPMITLGLGLQAKTLLLKQSLNISASGNDDPGGDIGILAEVADVFTPNVNLGLLIEPHKAISIGLAFQPPTVFNAKGSATLDLTAGDFGTFAEGDIDRFQDGNCSPEQIDPVCASEDGIGLQLKLPMVLRGGVAVRPRENLEIEVAVVWQNWRTLTEILLTDVDPEIIVFGSPAEIDSEFALPAGLRNTTSIRLGGEWRASDLLEFRAGGFYENGAFPNETLTVALFDPWKVQLGGGASLHPLEGRVRIDLAIAKIFYPTISVRDSLVEQVYIDIIGLGAQPQIIGNGDYHSNGWVAALQANVLLGKLK